MNGVYAPAAVSSAALAASVSLNFAAGSASTAAAVEAIMK